MTLTTMKYIGLNMFIILISLLFFTVNTRAQCLPVPDFSGDYTSTGIVDADLCHPPGPTDTTLKPSTIGGIAVTLKNGFLNNTCYANIGCGTFYQVVGYKLDQYSQCPHILGPTMIVEFSQPVSDVTLYIIPLTYRAAQDFQATANNGSTATGGAFGGSGSATLKLAGSGISSITVAPLNPGGGDSAYDYNYAFGGTAFTVLDCGSKVDLLGLYHCNPDDATNRLFSTDCSIPSLWRQLTNNTAYFRDAVVSARIQITNARGGDTVGVKFYQPDGAVLMPANGYITYDDASNCFNFSNGHQECGSNNLQTDLFFPSQCKLPGNWRVEVAQNRFNAPPTNVAASDAFTMSPAVGLPLAPFHQDGDPRAYDDLCIDQITGRSTPCTPGNFVQTPKSINDEGCTLVCLATILQYHGIDTDPDTLNDWLNANNGYIPASNTIRFQAIEQYAQTFGRAIAIDRQAGTNPAYNLIPTNLSLLKDNLCQTGPVVLGLYRNTSNASPHAVTAYGAVVPAGSNTPTTVNVQDPIGPRQLLLNDQASYPLINGSFDEQIVMMADQQSFSHARVTFTFFCPVQFFATDPGGHKVGYDPRTNTIYHDIPGAFYGMSTTHGPDTREIPKVLDIRNPLDGEYTITVIGTGSGTYQATLDGVDVNINTSTVDLKSTPIDTGVVHTYKLTYTKAAGSKLQINGSFDGGGQRPRDVNKLLSYVNISSSSTTLPTDTITYPLVLVYDRNIIPTSFKASLNGADISSLFQPTPGTSQTVNLTLTKGRNVLELSVDGNLSNHVANDKDRLVFDVQ